MSYPSNSDATITGVDDTELRAFVGRVERLHEERDTLGKDIADVYSEMKSKGYDTKAVKAIVAEKMPDMNAGSPEAAERLLEGTARSMGVDVR